MDPSQPARAKRRTGSAKRRHSGSRPYPIETQDHFDYKKSIRSDGNTREPKSNHSVKTEPTSSGRTQKARRSYGRG